MNIMGTAFNDDHIMLDLTICNYVYDETDLKRLYSLK